MPTKSIPFPSVIRLIWAYVGVVDYDLFDSPSAFFLHPGIAFHGRYFSEFGMLQISWCILFSKILVRWMPHVYIFTYEYIALFLKI